MRRLSVVILALLLSATAVHAENAEHIFVQVDDTHVIDFSAVLAFQAKDITDGDKPTQYAIEFTFSVNAKTMTIFFKTEGARKDAWDKLLKGADAHTIDSTGKY